MTKIHCITIEVPADLEATANSTQPINLPVTFAENPYVTALTGVWECRDITLEKLSKEVYGIGF